MSTVFLLEIFFVTPEKPARIEYLNYFLTRLTRNYISFVFDGIKNPSLTLKFAGEDYEFQNVSSLMPMFFRRQTLLKVNFRQGRER